MLTAPVLLAEGMSRNVGFLLSDMHLLNTVAKRRARQIGGAMRWAAASWSDSAERPVGRMLLYARHVNIR
jgi:hypothetical protein